MGTIRPSTPVWWAGCTFGGEHVLRPIEISVFGEIGGWAQGWWCYSKGRPSGWLCELDSGSAASFNYGRPPTRRRWGQSCYALLSWPLF